MAIKPLTNIFVKPAGPDCNMACRYCFCRCRSDWFLESSHHRMSDSVLDEMTKQLMRKGSQTISISCRRRWMVEVVFLDSKLFVEYKKAFKKRYPDM